MAAYLAMMPRLTAEESMLETARAQVGAGVMPRKNAQPLIDSWERLATGESPSARPRQGINLAVAAKFGITVKKAPKKASTPEAPRG